MERGSGEFIANALSPAKVVSVAVNGEEKVSRVVVPDYQLSLAIGKEGQNARLAAKADWLENRYQEWQLEQLELLARGCQHIQGFLLLSSSAPAPVAGVSGSVGRA